MMGVVVTVDCGQSMPICTSVLVGAKYILAVVGTLISVYCSQTLVLDFTYFSEDVKKSNLIAV